MLVQMPTHTNILVGYHYSDKNNTQMWSSLSSWNNASASCFCSKNHKGFHIYSFNHQACTAWTSKSPPSVSKWLTALWDIFLMEKLTVHILSIICNLLYNVPNSILLLSDNAIQKGSPITIFRILLNFKIISACMAIISFPLYISMMLILVYAVPFIPDLGFIFVCKWY